ncbi:polysaccharide deacetylase family protein [Prolixibacter sp. SD074]|jgi:peptidoglycan/xylan/chitin deacetylase (PgdA/CDA1 family)|uniref:polysaccharide deacetylase family protein n=1 Tax=Prolixibacter sp. SD074 TaxID=2652391 RepID=UPI00126A7CFF|nr:polysaccharide deacetylase family protein [Prolixibacter sp. SD074]GET30663.1 polysaccharide deacetylase [Prolixibacter sp. SD074]
MRLKPQVHLPRHITKWFPAAIWRIPQEDKKVVYLTFDDGPIPGVTPWVLKFLKENDIKATFFCVGENVFRYPEIFEQIVEDGHAVGNHTYHHIQGLKSENVSYFKDIEQANHLIGSNLFRPPHGWLKRSQYHFISQKYRIIMWDVISCDYNRNIPKEEVLKNVLKYSRPGSIITFHDSLKGESHLRYALPKAIAELKERGYEFRKIEFPKERPLFNPVYRQRLQKLRQTIRQVHRWA